MVTLIRTNTENKDFRELVEALDLDLQIRDGAEHSFFAQYNKTDAIKQVVVAYEEYQPIGCGAIKAYDSQTMEVKRMFVLPEKRGAGIASLVLQELEKWCLTLGFDKCILETGEKQPEAIKLYRKNNYTVIPNFGPYANIAGSVCFEKKLVP